MEIMKVDKFEILKVASKNLVGVTYENIFRLVNELELSNIISFPIPDGVYVFRIRPSKKEPFSKITEISFNPKAEKKFGRANTPNKPMFYGSFAAPNMQNPIITNTAEIIHILANGNNKIENNSVELTFGKWRIEKPLPVVPIIFNEIHLSKHKIFRPLYDSYMSYNQNNHRNKEIIKFIAQEFSKVNIKSNLDYKISAAFTELILKNYKGKIEAIIYPSVRTDGEGFNIAISPDFVKQYLKLHSVVTIRMYFKYGIGALDYEKIAESINEDGSFKLLPITEPGVTKGREWCMKELEKYKIRN
jgi:hypothetical protein